MTAQCIFTALVGHCLTAAAQGVPLLLDQMLKQGNDGGEASAVASKDWRVAWLRRQCVKDLPKDGLGPSTKGNYRDSVEGYRGSKGMTQIYEGPTMRDLRELEKLEKHDAARTGELRASAALELQAAQRPLRALGAGAQRRCPAAMAAFARIAGRTRREWGLTC